MQWSRRYGLIVILSAAMPLLGLGQPAATTWLDTFESRLEILALTQTLNAEILAGSSATQSLEKWCRDHKMAADPIIVARLIPGGSKAPTSEQLQRLQVPTVDDVRHRHVELGCGSHPLSEADAWYVPGRLTAEMNPISEVHERYQGQLLAFSRGQ